MIIRLLILIHILTAVSAVASPWIETDDLERIRSELKPGDVLVLDIDKVLVHSTSMLISDEGFWWLYEQCYEIFKVRRNEETARQMALNQSGHIWSEIMPSSKHLLVDSGWPELISDWQKAGGKVYVLTHRRRQSIPSTIKSLAELEINFGKGGNEDINIPKGIPKARFYDNIGFLGDGPYTKGEGIPIILQALPKDRKPRIIFIDDRTENLQSVHDKLKALGIDCKLIHYTKYIKQQPPFQERIANYQYHYHRAHRILLDDAAALMRLCGE